MTFTIATKPLLLQQVRYCTGVDFTVVNSDQPTRHHRRTKMREFIGYEMIKITLRCTPREQWRMEDLFTETLASQDEHSYCLSQLIARLKKLRIIRIAAETLQNNLHNTKSSSLLQRSYIDTSSVNLWRLNISFSSPQYLNNTLKKLYKSTICTMWLTSSVQVCLYNHAVGE